MAQVDPNATYRESSIADKVEGWERFRSAAFWEYREKWEEYPKKQIVGDFPIHLDIETTNACNLKCPMCPRTTLIQKRRFYDIRFMDFDMYKRIIDEGADHGLSSVKLNYMGEPLLHPDVVRQVKYAKQRGILDVMFNTNATLLSEELSGRLLDAGLDRIFFSFDSHRKEEYERIRVGASFERTVENIKTFVKIRNTQGYQHVETRVSMVIREGEMDKFLALKSMWKGIVDTVGYGTYVERDPDKQQEQEPVPGFICAQLWQRLFVTADGVVTPCCVDEKREYVLGDVNTRTLRDIWHGQKEEALRIAHKEGLYHTIGICRKCSIPHEQTQP